MNSQFMRVVVYGLMAIMQHLITQAQPNVQNIMNKWYKSAEEFVVYGITGDN